MSTNFTSDEAQDKWSVGIAWGCYQVHQAHQPYPTLMAFWVRRALRRIDARNLAVDARVVRFCEKWCEDAEASLGQCRRKCHRQPRGKTQRWRPS